MKGRKNLALLLTVLSVLVSFLFATTVMAQEAGTPKEIEKISIKVSQNKVGDVTQVDALKEGYTLSYVVRDNYVDVGDKPTIEVRVTAKAGYQFKKSFDKSSHFYISGGRFLDGNKVSATVVNVEIECKARVYDKLETPEGLDWEDGIATWEDVEDADYYRVKINGTEVNQNIYNNSINLSAYIKYKHNNRFQVKAFSNSSYLRSSDWSEKSYELYIEDWDEWQSIGNNSYWSDNSSPNYWNPNYWNGGYNTGGARNSWVQQNGKYYYYDSNGYKLTDGMYFIDGEWFYLDGEGQRKTGWQKYNGVQYYFSNNGTMVTGWRFINGAWFYFSETGAYQTNTYVYGSNGKVYYVVSSMLINNWHDGRYFKYDPGNSWYDGAMLRNCWEYIGGYWYYFNDAGYAIKNGVYTINGSTYKFDSNGRLLIGWFDYYGASYYIKPDGNMARNEWIEGYYVDGNGRWVMYR